ncbi:UNVERIFIED_CONTAM: Homeobox-leucine zipper protein ROC4 [Sesamum latifolium]|uniref:Homeobox-leucine zipper protein ROC4 n=1 Tax=Sesamum latifolium TaxID=2727402 RepID=A0AAW2TAX8_9LAMI
MSFGGFTGKSSGAGVSDHSGGGGGKMVADGLCSYGIMSTGAISQPLQMVHSSHSQPMFISPPLSLALNTTENKSSKRKKYHRHTAYQIQELEASFKENPHPDEKGRLELGKRLGLEPRQVKFWFQNRRTQMKTQLERHENSILKQENDKLRIENIAMKEAMRNPICENCGSPAILGEVPIEQHHLMIENARLKDELSRLGILANKFLTRNGGSITPMGCNSKLDLAVGRNGFCGLNSMDSALPLGLDFGNRMPNAFPMMPPNGPAMGMMV